MCGRYAITSHADAIARLFQTRGALLNLRERFNVAPTQDAPVIRLRDGMRVMANLRWGLIPSWAKDTKIAYSTINARVETVATKPAFRDAYRHRRCLVPADAFYEWRSEGDPRKAQKQPYRFAMKDGGLFAMAGLWERWTGGTETVDSFTVVVGPINDLMKPFHDRMPVILAPETWSAWLAGDYDLSDARPWPAELMSVSAVSTRLNNVKNDDASCIEPVAPAQPSLL